MWYFIKEALRGFIEAKLMTVLSIVTVGLTLFFLGVIGVGLWTVNAWLAEVSGQATVTAYLSDAAFTDPAARQHILETVRDLPAVDTVTLVDKEDAWNRFEAMYGMEMLEAVDENPLPASLEIVMAAGYRGLDQARGLVQDLRTVPGIEDIRHAGQWQQRLEGFQQAFRGASAIIGLILALTLYFMISNTIKLTIYARRDLVTNMHFVGATDLYIRMPFILEGMLQGAVGGALAIGALWFVRILLSPLSLSWGPWWFFPAVFTTGIVFGLTGSWGAVRKFLV